MRFTSLQIRAVPRTERLPVRALINSTVTRIILFCRLVWPCRADWVAASRGPGDSGQTNGATARHVFRTILGRCNFAGAGHDFVYFTHRWPEAASGRPGTHESGAAMI